MRSKIFFTLICEVAAVATAKVVEIRKEKSLSYDNVGKQNVPTELRCVKKINGENVKKALVPWNENVTVTKEWHFNAFSERN